jgi:hypothetical protein
MYAVKQAIYNTDLPMSCPSVDVNNVRPCNTLLVTPGKLNGILSQKYYQQVIKVSIVCFTSADSIRSFTITFIDYARLTIPFLVQCTRKHIQVNMVDCF